MDKTTLPEGYVLVSPPEAEIELGSGTDVPALVFQKHERELPVRKVLDTGTR